MNETDRSRTKPRLQRQSGEGWVSAIIWLAILAWCTAAGFEWIPKKYKVSQFQDAIVDAAARASREKEGAIKKGLLWRAQELGLPVNKDNLEVSSRGSHVVIQSEYVIPVNLPLYSFDWEVEHFERRRLFRGF